MGSLNYTTYVQQLSNLMVIPSTDANFQIFLPGCIDYAEGRIYRDLDPLYTQTTDASATVSSGNRNFNLPTSVGTFITCDNINIITPAGTQSSAGTRVSLTPVSPEFMDLAYPSGQTVTGVPQYYAMRSNTLALLGPAPDAAYYTEVIGTQRPSQLSSGNSSTFLTQYVPDLYIAASMVFAMGYMRDFGGQSDNPQASQSWENQYQILLKSAAIEQFRAAFESAGWTSNAPAPLATPRT